MRVLFAVVCLMIAVAVLGYLAVGWATTIWAQGLTASLTEQTTQPTFSVTIGGLAIGIAALIAGLTALAGREQK